MESTSTAPDVDAAGARLVSLASRMAAAAADVAQLAGRQLNALQAALSGAQLLDAAGEPQDVATYWMPLQQLYQAFLQVICRAGLWASALRSGMLDTSVCSLGLL